MSFQLSLVSFLVCRILGAIGCSVSLRSTGFPCHGPLHGIPHATHEDCAEQVLEGHEGIVDPQQQRRQAEVNKEDDNAKVDHRVWGLDKSLPLTDEDDSCSKAALGHERRLQELVRGGDPETPDKTLKDSHVIVAGPFDNTNEDNDEV